MMHLGTVLSEVHGEAEGRAERRAAPLRSLSLFLLDTYGLQRGCQCPDWERAGCQQHRAGQEVLGCLCAGHRCVSLLVGDSPEQSHGKTRPQFPADLPHCALLCHLPPEFFAVTFCVLLLSCKDLVGYIFTTDG